MGAIRALNHRTAFAIVMFGCFAMLLWLAGYPRDVPSDDALFFSRGLVRFDVLDFSPHFPGYPGLIALGRLFLTFTADTVSALFWVSVFSAAFLPLAVWLALYRQKAPALDCLLGGLAALSCPLVPSLGLSLLSDAPGLLVLAFGLAWCSPLPRKDQPYASFAVGLLLGCALAIRPSNAPYILPVLCSAAAIALARCRFFPANQGPREPVYPPVSPRGHGLGLVYGVTSVGVLCAVIVFAGHGWAYVEEGVRFVEGHSRIWGQTFLTADTASKPLASWLSALWAIPGAFAAAMVGMLVLRHWRNPLFWPLACGTVWVMTMQNPNNLRHLAPILILIAACYGPWHRLIALGLLLANLYCHAWTTQPIPHPSPLSQAITRLQQADPGIIISQTGLAVLRTANLPHQIVDAYYSQDVNFLRQTSQKPLYFLVSQHGGGRFIGENGLIVFEKAPPK